MTENRCFNETLDIIQKQSEKRTIQKKKKRINNETNVYINHTKRDILKHTLHIYYYMNDIQGR